MRRVVISSVIILILILIGTFIGIFYARGYRLNPKDPNFLQGTGVLVLTSKPDGARVLINDHVTTATNNTINLAPGIYKVRIEKEGYSTWQKTIDVKKEVVSQANALLFPLAPRLESVTTTGASNPIIDSTGTLIAFTVASASAENNGIYSINMDAGPIIPFGGGATQIVNENTAPFSQSTLVTFSPTGNQLVASVSGRLTNSLYLLSSKSFNGSPRDVTNTFAQIQTEWQTQRALQDKKLIDSLPRKLRPIAAQSFSNPVISPLEDKILYTASQSATIPIQVTPRLPGTNPTPEKRSIQKGNVYVYDLKEDRNYLIDALDGENKAPQYRWYPDSNHLVFVKNAKVNIIEADGTNQVTIYAGPFVDGFAFPWPDGSSIVILTNLNVPEIPTNLYRISLR